MDHFVFRRPDGAQDPQSPLVAAAWEFRVADSLISLQQLGAMNVTAWLYTNKATGNDEIYVRRNITQYEIIAEFGAATTKQAEIGFHAEALAGQFFLDNRMKVKEIFSDRVPCSNPGGNQRLGCLQLLQHNFQGVPLYFIYNSYDTTAAGNVAAAKGLSAQYPKRTPYTFPSVRLVQELQGGGRLPSHYRIYSL